MTKTIWKFPIGLKDVQDVLMPRGAAILSVDNQGGTLCLWAVVDPDAEAVVRSIEVIGTGNPIDDSIPRAFIGTALMPPFVWHVFERVAQ